MSARTLAIAGHGVTHTGQHEARRDRDHTTGCAGLVQKRRTCQATLISISDVSAMTRQDLVQLRHISTSRRVPRGTRAARHTCSTRSTTTRRARVEGAAACVAALRRAETMRAQQRGRGVARTRAHLQIRPARARRPLVLLMTEASVGGRRSRRVAARPAEHAQFDSHTHRHHAHHGRDINLRPPASALLQRGRPTYRFADAAVAAHSRRGGDPSAALPQVSARPAGARAHRRTSLQPGSNTISAVRERLFAPWLSDIASRPRLTEDVSPGGQSRRSRARAAV